MAHTGPPKLESLMSDPINISHAPMQHAGDNTYFRFYFTEQKMQNVKERSFDYFYRFLCGKELGRIENVDAMN
jgi:hypothetical protein